MNKHSESMLEIDGDELDNEENGSGLLDGEAEDSALADGHFWCGQAGVILGTLTGFQESGSPLVDFPGNKAGGALAARSTVALSINQVGSEVVLTFDRGDLSKPIIMGCLLTKVLVPREALEIKTEEGQLLFSARREIALSCGSASITLTRAGKILIRGAYLLSQSSGVNRIKGGSVQIN
jgi:hypothetical protein